MMHNKQTRMSWKPGGIWLGHPKAAQAAAGRERGSAIGWEPRTTKSTRVQGDNSTQTLSVLFLNVKKPKTNQHHLSGMGPDLPAHPHLSWKGGHV